MPYEWVKAFHIIAMVGWFAGLFYIFRLFVYHVRHRDNAEIAKVYCVMEYRLLFLIAHPCMFFTLVFGFWLLAKNPDLMKQGWLHVKLAMVAILLVYQFAAGRVHRQFAKGNYVLSERACKIINEIPAVALIVAVFLVVVKPY